MPESSGGEPLQPAQPSASGGSNGGPSGVSSGEAEPPEGEASVEITSSRYQDDIFEVKNIGSGSFGCAILVEARSTGERFVAKKITFEHLTPEEQLKAQNEAALLKSFTHVNITEYLGSFVIGNVLHIIMEYCSGGSLQQAMARRERANETFDEEEVFDWFLQVRVHQTRVVGGSRAHAACALCACACAPHFYLLRARVRPQIGMALEFVHSKRVLHRDIKPSNVFLTKRNLVRTRALGLPP